MPRTARRPLPTGRLSDREVTWYAVAVTTFGLIYLAATVNVPITLLAALSWLIYVWIYTPLKVFTAWQTPIGAIPGAMPALLGSAAAGATFGLNGLALFAIVYFWQFPHAMAIALALPGTVRQSRLESGERDGSLRQNRHNDCGGRRRGTASDQPASFAWRRCKLGLCPGSISSRNRLPRQLDRVSSKAHRPNRANPSSRLADLPADALRRPLAGRF